MLEDKTNGQLIEELKFIKVKSKYEQSKLQTLLDISTGLYESKTFEDMGKTISNNLYKFKLGEILGIRLSVYDMEKDEYTIVFQDEHKYEASKKIALPSNKPFLLKDVKYYSRIAIDQKKTLIIQDNHSEYSLSIDIRQQDIFSQSMIFIPLYSINELIGLLTIGRAPKNSMDADFVNFLESIAKYLSIAIAELFNRIKQKAAEETLAKERNLLDTIINIFPQAEIYVKDLDHRITFFNKALYENKGKKPSDLLGKTDFDMLPDDIASKYYEAEENIFKTGQPLINQEINIITHKGKFGAVLVNKWPLRDNCGKIIGLVGLNHGITDIKLRHDELKTLLKISDGLFLSKSFEDIGKTVFENLNRYRAGEFVFGKLAVYDSEEDKYSTVVNIDHLNNWVQEDIALSTQFCTLNRVKYFCGIALEQKKTLVVQNSCSDYALSICKPYNMLEYSMVFIPLMYKDIIVGLLSVSRFPKDSMDEEYIAFLESIAKYVSIAIGELQNELKHQKYERAIIESEERYRTLVETSPDAIALFDTEGKYLLVNQNTSKLHGFERSSEMIGRHSLDFLAPECMDFALKNGHKLSRDGVLRNIEYILLRKDGTRFFAETSFTMIYDMKGKSTGFLGIMRDITERKKAEEELNRTRALLEAALEQSDVAMAVASAPDMKLQIINSKAFEILGIETEEKPIGVPLFEFKMTWRDLREDGTPFRVEDLPLALALKGIKSNNIIDHVIRKDGTERWILVNGTPILGKNDEIIAGFLFFSDITEQKLVEMALSEEKERLAVTLRSIGDGVITTDISSRVILINKIGEELTGWKQHECRGKSINEIFHIINEQTREVRSNPVEKVLETEGIVSLSENTILISKDGKTMTIADSGSPIRDRNGKIIGVVLVFRDITEQINMEKEIQKIQKLESIGLLAGGIAHDFNNILTSIVGNISLAKLKLQNSEIEKTLELLIKTEQASLRAKDLTKQLLTFAKGGSPVLKTGSLEDVLKDSVKFALRGSDVKWKFSIPDNLWPVEMDEGQISQVIQNLIINADQAMPSGGLIKIIAENVFYEEENQIFFLKPGKYVKVTIIDQGIGIPNENLTKIFDPYFTTKQKGSGLGLSSSYSILKKHNGNITVYSFMGQGTVFAFYLPASQKEMEEKPKFIDDLTSGRGKILVMDDDKYIREIICEMLLSLGYFVDAVDEGLKAVELFHNARLNNSPYDLVIVDLTIPGGMGGKETVLKLLNIDPNSKVIVSSGYSTDPIMSEYWKYGFKAVITKPYNIEEVSRTLSHVLNQLE